MKIRFKFFIVIMALSVVHYNLAQAQSGTEKPLTLNKCLQFAIENNPSLKAMKQDVIKTKARIGEARSGFYPTISFSSDYRKFSSDISRSDYENYSSGFGIKQYLFQGGKTWFQSRSAKAGYHATEYKYQSQLQNLSLQVEEIYYRLLQKQRFVQVAEKAVERAKFHSAQAKARFEAGLASRSDILKAEVELSNAELGLIQGRNAVLSARGSLNALMGLPPHFETCIVDNLGMSSGERKIDLEQLIATALQNRTEVKSLKAQLEGQKANIQTAKAGFLPTVSANASYDWSGESPSTLKDNWSVGLSLDLPLFSGFSTRSKVSQEKAEFEALEHNQENLRQSISLEIWNAYLMLQEAKQKIDNTIKFLENARENLNIAEGKYREGLGSMLEVLDAQTTLVSAEENHIRALADHRIALASLDRVIGN